MGSYGNTRFLATAAGLALLFAPLLSNADFVLPPPPPLPGPTITAISIISSNASTTLAKVGDTVTLSFSSNMSSLITPDVTTGGHVAIVSGGGESAWSAAVTMLAGDTDGIIAFTAHVGNSTGTATTSFSGTTDGSSVYFDSTPPVITLAGDATMTLTVGGSFTDPGASATDTHDGSVSVSTAGSVDTRAAGTYALTYSARDTAGNRTTNVTRTVVMNAPDPAPSGGGGGGNGPPPASLVVAIGPSTSSVTPPPPETATSAPLVVEVTAAPEIVELPATTSTSTPAGSVSTPVIPAHAIVVVPPQRVAQVAAAASAIQPGSDYWLSVIAFLLLLLSLGWWVTDSYDAQAAINSSNT